MRIFVTAAVLTLAVVSSATQFPDAPAGFDNKTNGMVDDSTHQVDQAKFEEVEQLRVQYPVRADTSSLPTSPSLTEQRSSPAAPS
jgi:hypothetical protein